MCKGVDGLLRDAARSSETGSRHGHDDPETDRGLGKLRRPVGLYVATEAWIYDRDLRRRRNQLYCFTRACAPLLPASLSRPCPCRSSPCPYCSHHPFLSAHVCELELEGLAAVELHRVAPLASVVVVVVVGGAVPHTCRSCRHGFACRGSPPACP